MPDTNRILGERAIVLGAGIAGLAAAGVASNYFREVIVVERDALTDTPEVRKGVPQGAQIHNLLRYGLESFERIFPGFEAHLAKSGVKVDYGRDLRTYTGGGWYPQRNLGLTSYFQSRPQLELAIRKFLTAVPNVTIRDGLEFKTFLTNGAGPVEGVLCETAPGQQQELRGELVLDCTGRGSHTTEILQNAGFGEIGTDRIGIQLVYATAFFRKRPDQQGKSEGYIIYNGFPDTRFGALVPIENEGYLCTLGGQFGSYPPRDMPGFLEFARTLSKPDIYEQVHDLEVLQPVKVYRLPQTFWHRYDRLKRFPERFLPLGDAVAGFNPALGQGMSAAVRYAVILDEILARRAEAGGGLDGLSTDYLPRMAQAAAEVWDASLAINLAHPEATGERPENLMERLLMQKGLSLLAIEDEEVHRLTLMVRHMLAPRDALLRSDIVSRAMALAR